MQAQRQAGVLRGSLRGSEHALLMPHGTGRRPCQPATGRFRRPPISPSTVAVPSAGIYNRCPPPPADRDPRIGGVSSVRACRLCRCAAERFSLLPAPGPPRRAHCAGHGTCRPGDTSASRRGPSGSPGKRTVANHEALRLITTPHLALIRSRVAIHPAWNRRCR
jgi:hypothetical protein